VTWQFSHFARWWRLLVEPNHVVYERGAWAVPGLSDVPHWSGRPDELPGLVVGVGMRSFFKPCPVPEHQVKDLNQSGGGCDTASLLFQDISAGRATWGLAEADDFTFK